MNRKEKIFNIKVNKTALLKFMAKLFWYTLILITFMAFVLWIFAIMELHNAWNDIKDVLIEAWVLIRVPFGTSMLCTAWFGLIALFVWLVKKS